MKNTSLALVALTAIAQLAVLAKLIDSREHILSDGEAFNFKTRPIDPADPFQGRYVALGFENDYIPVSHRHTAGLRYRETIYATLTTNSDGFACFSGWSRERPPKGPYLKTRYLGEHALWNQATTQTVHNGLSIDLPFNRFYMDEAKAPRAEQAVRDATRGTNCWARVRILNGKSAVEDVFAKGQSLRDLASRAK